MKTIILTLCVCAAVSCGSRGRNTEDASTKQVVAVDTSVFEMTRFEDRIDHLIGTKEMGTIHEGEILKGKFVLRNKTGKPLVIHDMRVSCGCLTLEYDKQPIEQNKTVEVPFLYNSKGKEGMQFSRVLVGTDVSKYEVLIKIDVKPNK